jgi:hypothetical protein
MNKGTVTSIKAPANNNYAAALRVQQAHVFIPIFNYALSRRFDPAAKTTNAGMDFSIVGQYHRVGLAVFYQKILVVF